MLRKVILAAATGILTISAAAQTKGEVKLPPAISNAFIKLYPNAQVDKWEKEGNNYEADFKVNGVETSAEFGPNGQLIATEVEINTSDLPESVAAYFATNMHGKKISEASRITSANGTVSYEAEVDNSDYIFDSNGNFLKKEVEKDADEDGKK